MNTPQLVERVQELLTDELRRPEYRGHPNPLRGHCYVASEVLQRLVGGTPHTLHHEGGVHWYLVVDGEVLDATASQFSTVPDYTKGRGRGFLTKQPSRRAREVLQRLAQSGIDIPGEITDTALVRNTGGTAWRRSST